MDQKNQQVKKIVVNAYDRAKQTVLANREGTVILCHVTEVHGPPNPLYAHYSPWSGLSGQERAELRQTLLRSLESLVPEEARAEGRVATEVRVVETPLLVHEAICQVESPPASLRRKAMLNRCRTS